MDRSQQKCGWLRNPAPVDIYRFQHVSTILLVVQDFATIHSFSYVSPFWLERPRITMISHPTWALRQLSEQGAQFEPEAGVTL